MEDEGVVFEGLRLGSAQAFEDLLDAQDATMRRLALLYVPEEGVAALLRRTWSVALPGLDMFTWHTTLRAWVTGILVSYARGWAAPSDAGPARAAHETGAAPTTEGCGQHQRAGTDVRPRGGLSTDRPPWGSLAWSGLWGTDGWETLEVALGRLPLDQREVLWLHDLEGWPWREVLDALGRTAAQGEELLARGRDGLAVAVAGHVGAGPPVSDEERRVRSAGVASLLASLRPTGPVGRRDPELLRLFASWRRHRRVRVWRRWRWELDRGALRRRAARGS